MRPRASKPEPDRAPAARYRRAHLIHRIFQIGLLAKGVDKTVELIGGILLLVLSPSAIRGTILFLVQGELKEDPTDVVANLLVHHSRAVILSRVPAGIFLLVHGVVKLGLVGGLAAGKHWSYPAAIAVFAGFTIYQAYELTWRPSVFMLIVTLIDLIVVLSIIAEYRLIQRTRRAARR